MRPFPPTGGDSPHEIKDAGLWPVWPQQNVLFFRQGQDVQLTLRFTAMDISTKGPIEVRNRRSIPLQDVQIFQDYRDYDISPDGKRFVMIVPATVSSATPPPPSGGRISITLNWFEQLKTRGTPR